MSDAIFPAPRSSSAATVVGDGNRSNSRDIEVELDPNTPLVQSVGQNTDEDVTGGSEWRAPGKQKRKRTSPKDQAILEAEYKLNPKPNKAARAVIMEKVELNEKELQIWFQNRRQINRRKSRPLLPHEIAAFGLGGMASLSCDNACVIALSSSEPLEEAVVPSQQGVIDYQHNKTISFQGKVLVPQTQTEVGSSNSAKQGTAEFLENSNSLPQSTSKASTRSSPATSSTEIASFSAAESVIKSFSSTPGYLANRWNPANNSSAAPLSSQSGPVVAPPTTSNLSQPSSCLERIGLPNNAAPTTKLRLSMSLDGKAELVGADLSPRREYTAPPTSSSAILPQHRMRGLQRSHSALSFGAPLRLSTANSSLAPRLPRGLSRDARSWEFFCDLEARDELTTQAEHESNGSAVAAISLLRSASNSALKSGGNKRNAPSSQQNLSSYDKRPKLGRAISSLARLQGTGIPSLKQSQSDKGRSGLVESLSGDSDKENWIPEEGGIARRRPLPSNRADRDWQSQKVLGNNSNIPTYAVNFGGAKNRRRQPAKVEPQIFEDQENGEASQEVEKFMRGEVSPSKKGDLDCIQGLLSLSQGNWR